jgi:hypothetical protein
LDNTKFVAYYVDRFTKLLTTGEDVVFIGELDSVLRQDLNSQVHIKLLEELKKLKLQLVVKDQKPQDINIEKTLNRSVQYTDRYLVHFKRKALVK